MGGIFIGYRRSDSRSDAHVIYDHLVATFGEPNVFFDIASIAPGADFRQMLDIHLRKSSAFVALIGPGWLHSVDAAGNSRLNDPHDYVAMEITVALDRGIPIIPVLLRGAAMPNTQMLPVRLRQLCFLNAITIDAEAPGSGLSTLVGVLRVHTSGEALID
jgi:hypothetical protein